MRFGKKSRTQFMHTYAYVCNALHVFCGVSLKTCLELKISYTSCSMFRHVSYITLNWACRKPEKQNGHFPGMTAFEGYAVKSEAKQKRKSQGEQAKKPISIIAPGYLDRCACSLYLAEALEVTTKSVYRLLYRHTIL